MGEKQSAHDLVQIPERNRLHGKPRWVNIKMDFQSHAF
jgi:hypothetical protein